MLRIAMLCHSTNPRGGVAHALAVAEALVARGHHVVVHAPDAGGRGFPRAAHCGLVRVPAEPLPGAALGELVATRIEDYRRYFARTGIAHWDLLHVHDGIGANAVLALRAQGLPARFVRTVHHLDTFSDPRLAAWQEASVRAADGVACVSRHWQDLLRTQWEVDAPVLGNGVDLRRFDAAPGAHDAEVRTRYQLTGADPLILSIGGVEGRKNSVRLLDAFLRLRAEHPAARLVVVGGASLLDHGATQQQFRALLAEAGLVTAFDPAGAGASCYQARDSAGHAGRVIVQLTGPVPDGDVAPLLRAAQVLAFPSLHEGFGLVTLEALACGTPLVASRIAPFTEYLDEGVCAFADPLDAASIHAALRRALQPEVCARLRPAGLALARRHTWGACAERHEDFYAAVLARRAAQDVKASMPAVAVSPCPIVPEVHHA